ncbi:MAG TPA: aldo/keto reductase [Candidatus Xenobia bacterium]|jgi:predicted aldo/keto reductase-like oxidoreductase
MLPTRPLGKTGVHVSIFGLGGEGILRTFGEDAAAQAVIEQAQQSGVTYYDCARAYAGSESYYGLVYRKLPKETRQKLFQASKTAQRTAARAIADLDTTLRNMHLDHLDLWQIHDVREPQELDILSSPGGALEAADQARRAGKVRFVGVTGHYDPTVLSQALDLYPFDTVLLPVNPVEPHHDSFLSDTLPKAVAKGMGIIGMKVPLRGFLLSPKVGLSMDDAIRYALSQPISTAIIGCAAPDEVVENAEIATRFTPMTAEEQAALVERTRRFSSQLLFYKKGLALH